MRKLLVGLALLVSTSVFADKIPIAPKFQAGCIESNIISRIPYMTENGPVVVESFDIDKDMKPDCAKTYLGSPVVGGLEYDNEKVTAYWFDTNGNNFVDKSEIILDYAADGINGNEKYLIPKQTS